MSPLFSPKPVRGRATTRTYLTLALLAGAAFALGASRPRTPEGVTLCEPTSAAAVARVQQYFAAHPAHGGVTSPAAARVVTATFNASGFVFDADGNTGNGVDTVRINVGETVQFHLAGGSHTTTSGHPDDFDAGSIWSLPLDFTHQNQFVDFPTGGVYPFFCILHSTFNMAGVVVVKDPAGVAPGHGTGTGFVAPASPNPSRGNVAVRFAVPRAGHAQVMAFDAGGRAVATLFDRDVVAGTYAAAWTGRSASGERLAPGAYFLRLAAPGVQDVQRVVIVR